MKILSNLFALLVVMFLLSSCNSSKETTEENFFNGQDLKGWSCEDMQYWSVNDGAIVGHLTDSLANNVFLWSDIPVSDFYLELDVKMTPEEANAGIQIRSSKDKHGQAVGYQADIGFSDNVSFWGVLYDEHGRGLLDGTDDAGKVVKHNDWNHYQVLASGNKIWIAINGVIGAAVNDPGGETSGKIALQIHAGGPQTIMYKIKKLVHHPKIELAGLDEKQLNDILRAPLTPANKQAKIDYQNNQLVAFAGGTNVGDMQYNAYLETLIRSTFPKTDLTFRNLAWDGDTVFEQFRDIGFANWAENIDSLHTNVLFLQFGQMESLNGKAGIDSFMIAYQALIDKVKQKDRQIIILSPTPFEMEKINTLSAYAVKPDLDNTILTQYALAAKKLALVNNCQYVDLFNTFQQEAEFPFTTNGLHLNEEGHKLMANTVMKVLGHSKEYNDDLEPLRKEIIAKNAIWFNYWRPANWAFLKGDRSQVEFSRDWKNYEKKIFLDGMEEFKPILADAENKIKKALSNYN